MKISLSGWRIKAFKNKSKWLENKGLQKEVESGMGTVLSYAGVNVDKRELKFRADHPKKIDDPKTHFSPHQKKAMQIVRDLYFYNVLNPNPFWKDLASIWGPKEFDEIAEKDFGSFIIMAWGRKMDEDHKKKLKDNGILPDQIRNHWRNIFWAPYMLVPVTRHLIDKLEESTRQDPFGLFNLLYSKDYNPLPAATLLMSDDQYDNFKKAWQDHLERQAKIEEERKLYSKAENIYKHLLENMKNMPLRPLPNEHIHLDRIYEYAIDDIKDYILKNNLDEKQFYQYMQRLNQIYAKVRNGDENPYQEGFDSYFSRVFERYAALFKAGYFEEYLAFLEEILQKVKVNVGFAEILFSLEVYILENIDTIIKIDRWSKEKNPPAITSFSKEFNEQKDIINKILKKKSSKRKLSMLYEIKIEFTKQMRKKYETEPDLSSESESSGDSDSESSSSDSEGGD